MLISLSVVFTPVYSLGQHHLIWPCLVTVVHIVCRDSSLLGKIKRVVLMCSIFVHILLKSQTALLVWNVCMYVLLMYINVLHLSALTNLMNKLLHFLFFFFSLGLTGSWWSNLV